MTGDEYLMAAKRYRRHTPIWSRLWRRWLAFWARRYAAGCNHLSAQEFYLADGERTIWLCNDCGSYHWGGVSEPRSIDYNSSMHLPVFRATNPSLFNVLL